MSIDYACYAHDEEGVAKDGGKRQALYLQIEGMTCAACAFKIEDRLNAEAGVKARVNYGTQRLHVSWAGETEADKGRINALVPLIEKLGYKAAPFDAESQLEQTREAQRFLLRCLVVAGFATGNVMMFSQALWFSPAGSVAGATKDMMHWAMALIALPTLIYSGRPFFYSAFNALRHGRTNMDVPITLAVILTSALSFYETQRQGDYVYFDATVMLLFFLLIGRYLDSLARGKAREAAQGLLAMMEGTATLKDGTSVRIRDLKAGQVLLAATGEKIAADGVVVRGASDIDTSLITGETLPRSVGIGEAVYGGTINMSAPLEIEVTASGDRSLLSQVVALMEKAEQGQAKYVRIADRVSAKYAPVVHVLAAVTFLGWIFIGQSDWQDAMLKAMAVLIITCPCALGLAVPVVQVLASGELFRRGILLKSGKGLETLALADTVVFDKTGTLTLGQPQWLNPEALNAEDRILAVAMARQSRHPLSQALALHGEDVTAEVAIEDIAGSGLKAQVDGQEVRLGKGVWLGAESVNDGQMEMWFRRGEASPVRLVFADQLRADAAETLKGLKARGLRLVMLSGDRKAAAEAVASGLPLDEVRAELLPADKVAVIEALQAEGRKVLMVGDGLNDAAALSAAYVSMSPSSAMDVTQNAADFVWRGEGLKAVLTAQRMSVRTGQLVSQNFAISMLYNVLAVPLAVAGFVTPMIAAIAMSGSSLIVVVNAFRLKWGKVG
ncbi:heavy metal translocating P-type ATPase [Asticcacaulis tiandongensis]|uniref:heavy metal translocating P-type ATPase n=1 Tax=Asticcacaulis tiandongensis TaxID=2565365 RepID=UPI0011261283|nr:heavy metal translocating P-type ATPase [Asticcacaulis tiandongensis]